jgi:hypothetical protein
MAEKARRVLQAAAVEANGRPGMYVLRDRVMSRVNISDRAEFLIIAEHLDRKGWIPRRMPITGSSSSPPKA